jgi:hypothetical protein
MAGGLMQLVAYGAQDIYLTGNPQITFFKAVYRRYTNFAIETIEHAFIGNFDFGKRVTTILTRNADLINKIYIKVTVSSVDPDGNNFGWIKKLGHAIINQVEFEIGGTIIDRQTGTWMDIWYNLTRNSNHESGYSKMIGNIPELTKYNNEIKEEYTLLIPLQFWFNRYVGLSIPLIALQYHDARIHVTFSNKENLIIRDRNFDDSIIRMNNSSLLVNYIYLDTEERKRFAQVGHEYLIEQTQFNGVELATDLVKRYKLDYNHPTKEIIWAIKNGNFTNGKRFIYYSHLDNWTDPIPTDTNELITPIQEAACKIITESISIGINPETIVGGTWVEIIENEFETIGSINVQNNSTKSVYINSNSLSIGEYGITNKINIDITIGIDESVTCSNIETTLTIRDFSIPYEYYTVDTRATNTDPFIYQFSNYGMMIDGSGNPIDQALIQFNGHDRFDRREGSYFNYVQPYQHHTNTPVDGINLYSFALYPEEHQPSGTANLSRIDSSILTLWFVPQTIGDGSPSINYLNENTNLWIFGINYNVLRIMSGFAGLAYSAN